MTDRLERIAFAVAVGLTGAAIGVGITLSYVEPWVRGDAVCHEQCSMWREAAEVCLQEMAQGPKP